MKGKSKYRMFKEGQHIEQYIDKKKDINKDETHTYTETVIDC